MTRVTCARGRVDAVRVPGSLQLMFCVSRIVRTRVRSRGSNQHGPTGFVQLLDRHQRSGAQALRPYR
jgi:hypothetical protein